MSTIKCQNCGKEIDSKIMFLHERCCRFNVRKCSICEEPICIDEYNEHKQVIHPDIKCQFCGNTYKNTEYNSHLENCSKKMFECQFCGLFMNKSELKDHEYQCGSKTIICEFCNQGVPKMEYDLHLQYTCNKKSKKDKHSKIELKNENKINISPNKDLNYKPIKIINNCSENSSSKKITDDSISNIDKMSNIFNAKEDENIINNIICKNINERSIDNKPKPGAKKRKRQNDDDDDESYECNTNKKKSGIKKRKKF